MGLAVRAGDRVRIKLSAFRGRRGVVRAIVNGMLVVCLENSRKTLRVAEKDVTNFSLAARKAWKTLPTRRVGRPKGLRFCDRVSVTLRIDRQLWEEFQRKESLGVIADRTGTVNRWLREKLRQLNTLE
jgi:hypothetical protein